MEQNEFNTERWEAFTEDEKAHIATGSAILVKTVLEDPKMPSDFKRETLLISARLVNECAETHGVEPINESLLKAAIDSL